MSDIYTQDKHKNAQKMPDLTNKQKTIRFWGRTGYIIICFALAITVVTMNYAGCDDITGVRRGIAAATIIIWFTILRHTIHHRHLELELINRPGSLTARNAEPIMHEFHHMNIIAFVILLLINLPVMLYYRLYNPDIPQECESRHGYNTLLALLIFNSFPAGGFILLSLTGWIMLLVFVSIRRLGYWMSNYCLNYTNQHMTFLGFGRLRTPAQLPNQDQTQLSSQEQVVLEIELPNIELTDDTPTNNHPSTTTTTNAEYTRIEPTRAAEPTRIECPVCLEDKTIYIKMKCAHTICIGCANNWFGENQSCPVCRNDISQPPTVPEQPTQVTTARDEIADIFRDNPDHTRFIIDIDPLTCEQTITTYTEAGFSARMSEIAREESNA